MEHRKRWMLLVLTFILGVVMLSSCRKSAAAPADEVQGPKETVILHLVNTSDARIGYVYVDDMSGRARVRVALDSGYYSGANMRTDITHTQDDVTTVVAHGNDVNGNTGRGSTFPVIMLVGNRHASFDELARGQGITFNVYQPNGNTILGMTRKPTIVVVN